MHDHDVGFGKLVEEGKLEVVFGQVCFFVTVLYHLGDSEFLWH